MWFNSFLFALYFSVVLVVYHLVLRGWDARKRFLLVCSYVFYACWNPPFLGLLVLSSSIDYAVGVALSRETRPTRRLWLVAVSCTTNLGILGFFKYSRFLVENYDAVMRGLHLGALSVPMPAWLDSVLLPIGISFYTFHGMSYIVDVYRGQKKPVESWVDFYLFVSFFPQLVAGPILRATQFMPQLEEPRRMTLDDWETGAWRIVLGLFQKMVMADNIAPLANFVFASPNAFSPMQQWIGTYAFALQIYFDFAGYSNIALGVARMLGFVIPDNFNLPYLAVGFRDFWRRWHISLSTWLRDYLYIPLGGSRGGRWMTWRNLLITMFLGGLWHGATWSFAVWGLLHGGCLVVEHAISPTVGPRLPKGWPMRALGLLVTFHLTCIAWVFFRLSTSIGDALSMCRSMLHFSGWWLPQAGFERSIYLVLGGLGYLAAAAWESARRRGFQTPRWICAAGAGLMLYLVVTGWGNPNEFIYFQF
jgi:D-alanyl-lipoteichoic acid acyltransferase DltB (MBOAT superfamily)